MSTTGQFGVHVTSKNYYYFHLSVCEPECDKTAIVFNERYINKSVSVGRTTSEKFSKTELVANKKRIGNRILDELSEI